jgi:two-component system, NarL family, invasion response regulator UvrY
VQATAFPESATTPSLRERQVTEYLVLGHTYGSIAHRLGISPHTVDTYVRRIKVKLGAANRSQLVVSALAAGWVTPLAVTPTR